jgi:SAM-dependent methyltransferase
MINPKQIAALYGTREVMQAVAEYIHGDVLDFGAGKGKQKALALKHGKTYTSLDIEPHPSVDIVGDVLNPPIPDNSYDTIISTQVMEHVRKPWIMAQQIERILKPGGISIVTAPFITPFHADPHDYFRYTEMGMKSLFEDVGMEILLCTKHGGWWSCVGEIVKQKFCSPYKKRTWLRSRIVNAMESMFRILDKTTPPGIAYCNVLCIARKRS